VSRAAPSFRPVGRSRMDPAGLFVLRNADTLRTPGRSMIWGESRDQLVAVGERLAAADLVRHSEGNLSLRIDESRFLVTSTGSDLGRLEPTDLVEVNLEASAVPPRATSEVHLHLEIYRRRADVLAIVHAHPPLLLRLDANGGLPRSRIVEDRGRMLGRVVSAAHFKEGSLALAEAAASALARSNACVLCGHGAVTLGSSLMRAFVRMLDFERAASLTPMRG
jgi:L-fuculose-phosphate aldolase